MASIVTSCDNSCWRDYLEGGKQEVSRLVPAQPSVMLFKEVLRNTTPEEAQHLSDGYFEGLYCRLELDVLREVASHRPSGMIIPSGADAKYWVLPESGQKNAVTGFVGIDLQLFCESPDVAFDGARRQPHGLSNFRVTEAHGQKIKDFGFPRGHVNRTLHSLRRRHGKYSSNFRFGAGTARWW